MPACYMNDDRHSLQQFLIVYLLTFVVYHVAMETVAQKRATLYLENELRNSATHHVRNVRHSMSQLRIWRQSHSCATKSPRVTSHLSVLISIPICDWTYRNKLALHIWNRWPFFTYSLPFLVPSLSMHCRECHFWFLCGDNPNSQAKNQPVMNLLR